MDTMTISERIKARCREKNRTVKSVLEQTNINKGLIYDIQQGHCPSVDKLVLIADCLDCSVDYLLGRTDVPHINKG